MNKITVNNKTIFIDNIIITIDSKTGLNYINRLPFNNWMFINISTNLFPFGKHIVIVD